MWCEGQGALQQLPTLEYAVVGRRGKAQVRNLNNVKCHGRRRVSVCVLPNRQLNLFGTDYKVSGFSPPAPPTVASKALVASATQPLYFLV